MKTTEVTFDVNEINRRVNAVEGTTGIDYCNSPKDAAQILEREGIEVEYDGLYIDVDSSSWKAVSQDGIPHFGATEWIAGMRCFVANH